MAILIVSVEDELGFTFEHFVFSLSLRRLRTLALFQPPSQRPPSSSETQCCILPFVVAVGVRHVAEVIVLPGVLVVIFIPQVGEDCLVNGGTGGSDTEIAWDGGDLVG